MFEKSIREFASPSSREGGELCKGGELFSLCMIIRVLCHEKATVLIETVAFSAKSTLTGGINRLRR